MGRFVFRMMDGSEWSTDSASTRPLSDEIAFERYFKQSAAVVSVTGARAQQYIADVEEATKAGQPPPEMPDGILPRTEWLAFFSWRQLRRSHPEVIPATFDDFIDTVEDMDYQEDDDAAAKSDQPSNVVALEASGLDPTAPAAPPTPPPVSSWPASAGNRSS